MRIEMDRDPYVPRCAIFVGNGFHPVPMRIDGDVDLYTHKFAFL